MVMCRFIGMECLAAYIMIQLHKESVSLKELNEYGISVMKSFDEQGIRAVVLYTERYADITVQNYSDCFELIDGGNALRRKVREEELISRFLAYLATDVLVAISRGIKSKQ